MSIEINDQKSDQFVPAPVFHIGPIPVTGDLVLAPMSGFSDLPFRSLCRKFGSSLSYTAFINAMDVLHKWENTRQALQFFPEERPVIFQLFDNSHDRILEAARVLEKLKPDAIDINMGCSTRRVSGRGAGAGLLKDPQLIGRIICSLNQELTLPVTAKIRLGWDSENLNYIEVCRAIEDNGGAMIAVHARTRVQAYRGNADWDAISHIKQNVSIPVMGNGDVCSLDDIEQMKRETGCDAVMIGRCAVGNPWIFQRKKRALITKEECAAVISEHLAAGLAFYGEKKGIETFRKHLVRYLAPDFIDRAARQHILTRKSASELEAALGNLGYPVSLPDTPGMR